MAVSTKENGGTTRWRDMASSSGPMAGNTAENMSMTKKREWGPSTGKNIIIFLSRALNLSRQRVV